MNVEEKTILIQQWQTCVEMANSTSQRRDTMNNIFISLNIAILAATSIVWGVKPISLFCAGIALCILWLLLIRNYKALNTEKFNIIIEIEEKLGYSPFKNEWEL